MLDIVIVTFNSKRWLDDCVASLAHSACDLQAVTLTFVDNASSDGTPEHLKTLQEQYCGVFGDFRIAENEKNLGFGGGNNAGAKLGNGDLIFCVNADTTVYPDTIPQVLADIEQSAPTVGLWELRQFPYEHPKLYNPLTFETTWSSGACFVIRRSLWEQIGGFDEEIFLYCEDVDLSWRVRAEGYTLRYVPKAVVNHYCYKTAGEIKPNQYVYSLVNNVYLRHKFGKEADIQSGHKDIQWMIENMEPFPQAGSMVREALEKAEESFRRADEWRLANAEKLEKTSFPFNGWDYEIVREGSFFENERPKGDKKVSVIVRTCGRPSTLRETLMSLRTQTYQNIEIVVVEDGRNVSEKMLRHEFADLNIVYRATGKKVGRSKAGNIALSLATGDYCNFLDDDDLFFADHIETLVMALQRHPEARIAHSLGVDTPIKVVSREPYQYQISSYNSTVKERFNRLALLHHNQFPIQAVMFQREIFQELGGFDEELDVLEDWDLWVRYACRYPFHAVWKTTSIYRVPQDRDINAARKKELDDALMTVRQKHLGYKLQWTSRDLVEDYQALVGITEPLVYPELSMDEQALRVEEVPSMPAVAPVQHGLLYRAARKCYRLVKAGLKRSN